MIKKKVSKIIGKFFFFKRINKNKKTKNVPNAFLYSLVIIVKSVGFMITQAIKIFIIAINVALVKLEKKKTSSIVRCFKKQT